MVNFLAGSRSTSLLLPHPLQLPPPVHLPHARRIIPPTRLDLHPQVQEYLRAQNALEFFPRCRPNLLDGLATASNQNALLPFALHLNRGMNANQPVALLK